MNWPQVRLADCSEIVSGATPKTSIDEYWGGPIAWATPKDLSTIDGKYIHATPQTLTESGYKSCSAKLMPERSVLFSSRAPIGHVAINTVPMCTNQGFKSFVPDSKQLSPDYLYYWLKANKPYLQSLGNGATFKEVSKATVADVKIPLPPLPEQRRIAAILDQADALRAKRRAAIAKCDQLLQAVFLDMFGDPVTNPKGWPTVAFSDVATSRLGKMLDKRTQSGPHMKPYLANFNVQWGRFELGQLRQMNFDKKDQSEFSLKYGDLLVCEGGEPGRCAIWRNEVPDCYFQKALHRVRCIKDQCTPEYLQHLMWLLASRGAFSSSVSTATIAHLTGIQLKKLQIPQPPIETQQRFSIHSNAISNQKNQLKTAESHLDSLFASLQQRAFTGQLSPAT